MSPSRAFCRRIPSLLAPVLLCAAAEAQNLEIHYINVGWGGSVLVRGPNGTTVLLEGGRPTMGTNFVVPYLTSIGIDPADGLDYMILGHRHTDHVGGMDEVVKAGYDVHVANYENGSPETRGSYTDWVTAATGTTAGAPVPMPVGTVIPLGNGATMTCIARNGNIIGGGVLPVDSENDRSIALLVQYGGFDFLWGDDISGSNADEPCTGRGASTLDVETPLLTAISPGGAHPMITAGGIDVLHVNHHGAETSSNANYMNMARPTLACISIGAGQSLTENRPRIDVVEHVLQATVPCVTAPPALVLQTEEGNPVGPDTSYAGFAVGDIMISTNGVSGFTVSADGLVTVGPDERAAAGLPRTFALDDNLDVSPPAISAVTVTGIAATTATVQWTTDEVSTSVVRYGLTTAYGSSASSGVGTSHSVALTGLTAGALYHFRVESTDQIGNAGASGDAVFHTAGSANFAPTALTVLQGKKKGGDYTKLAANDNKFVDIESTTTGTRTSDWYGSATVPVPIAGDAQLTVAYSGKSSKAITQKLHLWNWNTSAWDLVDTRSLTAEQLITVGPTSASPYVSATGAVRLRVQGVGTTTNFTSSGDYLRFTLSTAGTSP